MKTQNQIRMNIDTFGCEGGSTLQLLAGERKALGAWAKSVAAVEAPGKPVTFDFVTGNLDEYGDIVILIDRNGIAVLVNLTLDEEDFADLLDIVGTVGLRLGYAGAQMIMDRLVRGAPNEEGLIPVKMVRRYGELVNPTAA